MKKKTDGHSFNFFQLVSVDGYNTFSEDSQVTINIRFLRSFSLVNYGPSDVYYSLDGNNISGDMRVGTPTAAIMFDNRAIGAVWLIKVNPNDANSVVRVEAWA